MDIQGQMTFPGVWAPVTAPVADFWGHPLIPVGEKPTAQCEKARAGLHPDCFLLVVIWTDNITLYFCFLHNKEQRFAARITCDVACKAPEILPDLQSKHYLYC